MNQIQDLEAIINDPNTTPFNRKIAEAQLKQENERLAAIGGARVQIAQAAGGSADEQITAILEKISEAMRVSNSPISAVDIRQAVIDEVAKRKINIDDLSKDLLAWLNSQRTVRFSTTTLMGVNVSNVKATTLANPLIQLILSDIMARNNTYLYGGAGTGKAQPLHAKILTKNGWVTFKDIKAGDDVYGHDGNIYKIDAVYERGLRSVYRVITNDGGVTECCNEHLWKIQTRSERSHKKEGSVKPLSDIIGKLTIDNGCANAYIPVSKPISFEEKPHIIHPYILGVLIGDGGITNNNIIIHTPDEFVINKVIQLLPSSVEVHIGNAKRSGDCPYYSIVSKEKGVPNVFREELKRLGLMYKKSIDKHIPSEYLFDSIKNRQELLYGLNDTDGYAMGNDFEYSTSSGKLSDDYLELTRGLGFVAKKVKRDADYKNASGEVIVCNESYRLYVNFGADFNPFSLPRKADKYTPRVKYLGYRFIENIEYIGEMETRCISITSPEHLYITDDYIVTHNTYIAEEVAEMLGWEKITLNCNQFTSPLDIIGGQTTEGYQEGKLSMAWSNTIWSPDGTKKKADGCVLILDELPKIDPNTAGILNEALAKIKQYKYEEQTKTWIPPTIRNGRNETLVLGNLFVIATGNVPLNTIDPDYEANFKQDLSLQDRFIGSTYKVFVNYRLEFESLMKGFAFIWIFLIKVREALIAERYTSQVFVSMRIMANAKATYVTYREVLSNAGVTKATIATNINVAAKTNAAITAPKTIIQTMDALFGLLKDVPRENIINKVNYEEFKKIVAEKDKMPYDPSKPDFDTKLELMEVNTLIEKNELAQKQKKG